MSDSVYRRAPLGAVLYPARANSRMIKGDASTGKIVGFIPAYSASGQDIWVPDTTAHETRPGLVLSAVGARCGKTFLAHHKKWSTVANTVSWVFSPNAEPRFVHYVVNDETFWVKGGAAQPYVRVPDSLRKRIPFPDAPMQRRIADYLDRETAKIDSMAEALDGLVARLEERRVAAIENATHALSESSDGIPHGWVSIPFKWAVEAHFPGDWGGDAGTNDTDRLCVRVADFDRTSGTVGGDVPTLRSYTNRSANERHLRTHDLLLEKSGGTPKNPVGRVVLYTGRPGRMTTNFVQCIRLNADHESRFWHYVFLAAYKTRFTNVHVRQTTGIQNLDIGGFFDEKFACPPLEEQRRIADHLDAETAKIDAMIAKAGELRALLDERRSALITATVTGQHPVPEEP